MIDTHSIFNIKNQSEFKDLALNIFKYQFENNRVYRSFCDLLYKHPSEVNTLKDIPFIPIQFFKTRDVLSSSNKTEATFTSSGFTFYSTNNGATTSNKQTLYTFIVMGSKVYFYMATGF